MGLYSIACPSCGEYHMWFSGNKDQLCEDCKNFLNKEKENWDNIGTEEEV